ncbi:MAG: FkbM family methyltransferase [Clostridiales bacterium]|nr:FkbM family methyltransferase [Clostridiales bacterium]
MSIYGRCLPTFNKRAELNITETDVWQSLLNEKRPIVLYGMGNGADRILAEFARLGIKAAGIFASDDFVRYQTFHGMTVVKYSDICSRFQDFVIVVSFGTNVPEVLQKIEFYSKCRTLFAPDIPVCGSTMFTKSFFCENKGSFDFVYSRLADDESRRVYENIINYKISGKVKYLYTSFVPDKASIYKNILRLTGNETIVDMGAYNGDTVREFAEYTNNSYRHIYALEPDSKNFCKLQKNTAGMQGITLYNIGAWSKRDRLIFSAGEGRNSHMSSSGSAIEVCDIDSLIGSEVTLLKMDIEGAELKALAGCEKTIKKYLPKLYICAYHRSEDLFSIPQAILKLSDRYKIYFRHSPYVPAWESNFYCIAD